MKTMSMSRMMRNAKRWSGDHSPEILMGFGIAGIITTVVLSVKATPKALMLLEDAKKEKGEDLTKTEIVKIAWKPYIPVLISGGVSISCLIGANSVNAKRNAALAAAYKISETALSDYREKVIETIGEKKEKAVRDKVAQKRVESNPSSKNSIIINNNGNTLCYETVLGRYFKSDIDKIKKTVNELNSRMLREGYVSLTDFYNEIGLTPTSISDDLGWNVDNGLIEIYFSSQLADDGTPCIVVDYEKLPFAKFNHFG